MKKVATLIVVVCMAVVTATPLMAAPPVITTVKDLIADGPTDHIKVGEVTVTDNGSTMTVTFQITELGWVMTQTHLAVATSFDDIPQTGAGNPQVGRFTTLGEPGGVNHDPPVTTYIYGPFDIDCGTTYYIAAHALVWGGETTTTVVSGPTTLANGSAAVRATEPGVGVTYPACPAGDNDAIASLWDSNAKLLGGASPDWGTADWIWSTAYPAHPVSGEVVNFSAPFTIPGLPIGGSLMITADNAYSAELNGSAVGHSISAGPAFPGVLKENVGSGNQVGQWGVASQGWQLVDEWTLAGLVSGNNTLAITAANEYMSPDDSYLSWGTGTQAYTPGTNNTDPDGATQCINPAGLIFKLTVNYYERQETAWGDADGTPFGGNSWATYFTHEMTCY